MKHLDEIIAKCHDVKTLAEGGQKKVLAADHPDYGQVVIKFGEFGSTTSLDRISREIQLLKDLDSDFYPRHYESLIDPVTREFLVLEERFSAVELTHATNRFTTDDEILGLLKNLVSALNVIWKRNVIHRDIKPANILITDSNEPRIIDLGIARFLDDKSLTATIADRGPATPIYAAPEQLQNKKTMINVRTDFFLLGIVVLELLLGFHPFDSRRVGNSDSTIDNILNGRYVRLGDDINTMLREFIEKALQPKPYHRFPTVTHLKKHLGIGN